MERIGFSTGSLARSDAAGALHMLRGHGTRAVELSALRAHELGYLLDLIPELDLRPFDYVSVHAPSAFPAALEAEVARALLPLADRGWPVVLHPDAIRDPRAWLPFEARLCIENMDRRKPVGRSVEELQPVFTRLPEASFCFDIAHARQCDPSMAGAYRLLNAFGDRLAQVHVSELDAHSCHVRLTRPGVWACQKVASSIPADVPAIIEAPVRPHEIAAELEASAEALGRAAAGVVHAS